MKQIIKNSILSLAGLGFAVSAVAQTTTISPSPTRTPLSEQRQDIRNTLKDGMGSIRDMRQLTKEEVSNLRLEYQTKIREAQAALKAKVEAKRAVLKQDLKKVRDEKKKQITEKIDKGLDALNERMTGHFSKALEKLEDVLVRIDERTDRAEASKSVDVASVRAAIEKANLAIATARTAVQAQAGKTYKIEVTTDNGMKDAVKKAREMLSTDLRSLRDIVKSARDAVHDAARAFAKAHGRDLSGISSSPSVSPSTSPLVSPSMSPTSSPTTSPNN